MKSSRIIRLSYRLAALEDLYIHPEVESDPVSDLSGNKQKIHLRKIQEQKTKETLEKYFRRRNIPLRFVYAGRKQMSAIGKPGVITFQYSWVGQEPPTPWMIIHNLAHAIYEPVRDMVINAPVNEKGEKILNPFYYSKEEYLAIDKKLYDTVRNMNLIDRNESGGGIYPTTKSQKKGIEIPEEAFYEIFTQWVVRGGITLQPNSSRSKGWEIILTDMFRKQIDWLARKGYVLYNKSIIY